MNKSSVRNLLSFYSECLEEEDLRSLNFNVAQLDKSFVLGGNGSFVSTGKALDLPAVDAYFWNRNEPCTGEQERVLLGYPILLHKNTVTPLFFLEMNVRSSKEKIFTLTVADSSCFLNHHLFGKKAYDIEGSVDLQSKFECDLSAFEESLSKALKFLDVQLEKDILKRQDFINGNETDSRWAENFILFRGGRSAVNAMLRRDITTFLKYPKLIDNISGTAFEALLKQGLSCEDKAGNKSYFSALNDDQRKAINTAFSQKLTVITGPPGTGKSQVVANILARCALEKKSVLFASKNNKAVDVVYEKLRTILSGKNWIFRLGNREKVEECKNRMINQLGSTQEAAKIQPEFNEYLLEAEHELSKTLNLMSQLEKQQNILADYEARIRALESKVDDSWLSQLNGKDSWDENDEEIQDNVGKCYRQLIGLSKSGFSHIWLKLVSFFFPERLKKYYRSNIEAIASVYMDNTSEIKLLLSQNDSYLSLQDIYSSLILLLKIKYLSYEKSCVEKALLQFPTAQDLKTNIKIETGREIDLYSKKLQYSWDSQIQENRPRLFALCRRYFNALQNPPQNYAGWKQFGGDFKSLVDDFYIWIVTSLSARKCMPLESGIFDVVVIDEASQCDILSAIPLLYRAKSAIIIGDPNQLRHITLISAKKEEEIAKKYHVEGLLADWSYRNKSIYDLAESKLLNSGMQPQLLSYHYRCHPEIIDFSNRALYDNKLSPKTEIQSLQKKFQNTELGVFWHDVKGSVPNSSSSAYNQDEIDYIISLIDQWRHSLIAKSVSIGIVTPFMKQVEKLKVAINKKINLWGESFVSSIMVGTAHRFQGDECDIIIFSPVVASGIKPHLANWVASTEELLNVAVTRARAAFHVVGDETSCREAGFLLKELAIYIHNSRFGKGMQFKYESPAEEIVGNILSSLELPFFTQVEKGSYRLDFIVVTPFGNKINLEVDGSQHCTPEHISKDEIRDRYISDQGYKVVRLSAKDVFSRRDTLIKRLSQLV